MRKKLQSSIALQQKRYIFIDVINKEQQGIVTHFRSTRKKQTRRTADSPKDETMKLTGKLLAAAAVCAAAVALFAGCSSVGQKGKSKTDKHDSKKVQLSKGTVEVYDFGAIKLHAFKTNDRISDECFLVEKNGKVFMIESPCFFDNIAELTKYVSNLGADYVGTVIAYHAAGASFMSGKPVYSTKNADAYNHNGGGAALVNNFAATFGKAFDKSLYKTTNFIEGNTIKIADVELKIVRTQEAFDIELPEINAVYTHMLGHDVHSIVAGSAHADAIIARLEDYIKRGIGFILTSHYTIEDISDAKQKIAYLRDLKNIALKNADTAAFKKAVQEKYGSYGGLNYLDMTAAMFYTK